MKKVLFSFVVFVFASVACFSSEYDGDLMEAVRAQNLNGVRSAIAGGANLNYKEGENTVLMEACWSQNLEIVQLLLQKRANASFKNANGVNALMIACRECKHLPILKLLVQRYGANVDDTDLSGQTVLMYAMQSGNINTVAFILDQKITNYNAVDNTGMTAAMWAVKSNNGKIIELLNRKCTGVEWSGVNIDGDNVLSLALKSGGLDLLRTIFKIVGDDLDVDMRMKAGMPTLFWAIAENKSQNIIEFLMNKYRDKDQIFTTTDENGNDIFYWIKSNEANKKFVLGKLKKYAKNVGRNIDEELAEFGGRR